MTPLLYKYTEPELKRLLKTLTVICDSREKENEHITTYFEAKKIPYIHQALSFGDYSFMLPACQELGISRDIYFANDLVIERKNSIEELSANVAQHRERFEHEFLRAGDCDFTLLIENNGGGFNDIINHKYNSKLSEKAFLASLLSWEQRYKIRIAFVSVSHAAHIIY